MTRFDFENISIACLGYAALWMACFALDRWLS